MYLPLECSDYASWQFQEHVQHNIANEAVIANNKIQKLVQGLSSLLYKHLYKNKMAASLPSHLQNISQKAVPDNWWTCPTQVCMHSRERKNNGKWKCRKIRVYKVSSVPNIYKHSRCVTHKQVRPRNRLTAVSYAYLYILYMYTHKTHIYHCLYTLREVIKRVMWHFAFVGNNCRSSGHTQHHKTSAPPPSPLLLPFLPILNDGRSTGWQATTPRVSQQPRVNESTHSKLHPAPAFPEREGY